MAKATRNPTKPKRIPRAKATSSGAGSRVVRPADSLYVRPTTYRFCFPSPGLPAHEFSLLVLALTAVLYLVVAWLVPTWLSR